MFSFLSRRHFVSRTTRRTQNAIVRFDSQHNKALKRVEALSTHPKEGLRNFRKFGLLD